MVCPCCKAALEYEDSDVHNLCDGYGFVCPECGRDVVVEAIVIDRPVYPDNFFKFGEAENAYIVSNKNIQKWCDEIFDSLKNSEDSYDWSCYATGNAMAFGKKYEDGEIDIIVAKNYEEYSYFPEDN